jgi:hypothetical protein
MELPFMALGEATIRHSDCCLGLSAKLMDTLIAAFGAVAVPNQVSTVLSIGSGTGLLEALLLARAQWESSTPGNANAGCTSLSIEGVEVPNDESGKAMNKYLPEQAITTVRGTWEVSTRLADPQVCAIMFIYPRQPSLVSKYVASVVERNHQVRILVWLGPVADWEEFRHCFTATNIAATSVFEIAETRMGDSIGVDSFEMMVMFRR